MKAEIKKELWGLSILAGIAIFASICELFYQYSILSEDAEKPIFTGFVFEFNPYEHFLGSTLTYFILLAFSRYLLLGIIQLFKVKPTLIYFLSAINLLILIRLGFQLWYVFFPEELLIEGKKMRLSGGHQIRSLGGHLLIFFLMYGLFFSITIQILAIKSLIFSLQKRPKI